MKPIRIIAAFLLSILLISTGCSNKDKYTVGAATISGTVTFKNSAGTVAAAPFANVNINYNSSKLVTPYNQTLVADANGKFSVKLPAGNYFFSGSFTDENGFNYATVQGSAVTVGNTSDQVTGVAIIVQ